MTSEELARELVGILDSLDDMSKEQKLAALRLASSTVSLKGVDPDEAMAKWRRDRLARGPIGISKK